MSLKWEPTVNPGFRSVKVPPLKPGTRGVLWYLADGGDVYGLPAVSEGNEGEIASLRFEGRLEDVLSTTWLLRPWAFLVDGKVALRGPT